MARISESLAALGAGDEGVGLDTVRGRSRTSPHHGSVTLTPYEVRFQAAAPRAISHRLPEAVAAAVIEFCAGPLAKDPHRVGRPLFGPLAGCHGARRGTYRVVYRVDDVRRTVQVLDVDHRVLEKAGLSVERAIDHGDHVEVIYAIER